MKKKWEVRFLLNNQQRSEIVTQDLKEKEVRQFIIQKYGLSNDRDILNVSGAFEPIPGKKIFLGTHAINSSLDLGFPYSKSGNKFYELINPELEMLRKIIEKDPNPENSENAILKIEKYFKDNEIGIADMIDFCESTSSKDQDICLNKPIVWNEKLLELLENAELIILNGKSTNSKSAFWFLKKYCRENGITIQDGNLCFNNKIIKCTMVYGSSGGVRERFHKDRKEEWKKLLEQQ